jgi:glycosyltransferase 2 family protein
MNETPDKPSSRLIRILKLLAKILVTLICLWYVSRKINFREAFAVIQKANWLFIFLALLLFSLSKVLSSIRLNIYFRNIRIKLAEWTNMKLYWLGMFYNLFLPGSITGDAYKVIRLTKTFGVPYKKTSAAVLLDRFSGLAGLGLILAAYGIFVLPQKLYVAALVTGAILAVAGLYFVIRFLFPDFLPGFTPTLLWGIAVQFTQVLSVYCIIYALRIPANHTEYIFIFLVSSVVAVLPVTIGGLGARELVFLWGANYFGLHQESSVMISLLFYFITVFTSSWGLVYVYVDPLKEEAPI